VFSSLKML